MHWAKTYLDSSYHRLRLVASNPTDLVVYLFLCHRGRHTTTVSQVRDEIEEFVGVSKKASTVRQSLVRLLSSGVIRRKRIGTRGIIEVWITPASLGSGSLPTHGSISSNSTVGGPPRGSQRYPQGPSEVPSGDLRGPLRGPPSTNPWRGDSQRVPPLSSNIHRITSTTPTVDQDIVVNSEGRAESGLELAAARWPSENEVDARPSADRKRPPGSNKITKKEMQNWIASAIDTVTKNLQSQVDISHDPSEIARRKEELRLQAKRLGRSEAGDDSATTGQEDEGRGNNG